MRSMKSLVAVFALALALVPAAGGSQTAKTCRFRVVSVTHHSSSQKTESAPYYTGSSTSTWHLVAATRKAPNRISITTGSFYSGGGTINVKGTFTATADSQFGGHPNHCQLSASTGSTPYPAVAPHRFPGPHGTDFSSPRRAPVGRRAGGELGTQIRGRACRYGPTFLIKPGWYWEPRRASQADQRKLTQAPPRSERLAGPLPPLPELLRLPPDRRVTWGVELGRRFRDE